MSSLWAFTVEADVDGRLARKRNSERAALRRKDSALQRVLCRRQSGDVSLHCKSPCTKTFSTTTTSSAAVSTIPRLCGGVLLGRRSIFSCQSLLTGISFRPDFSLCVLRHRTIRLLPSTEPPSLHASIWMQFMDAEEDSDAKSGDALSVSLITVILVTRVWICWRMIS